MLLRSINLALLLAAVVGGWLAIRGGMEYQRLREAHRQLAAEVGLLPVADPDQVHLVALKRDDPLDFAWQMYVPARFDKRWEMRHEGGSTGHHGSGDQQPYFDLVRVRFRKNENGQWEIWHKQRNGSGLSGIGSRGDWLEHPEDVVIDQAAADGIVQLDREHVLTLLHIKGEKTLLRLRFGTPEAFALEDKPWGWQETQKAKTPKK